MFSLECVLVPSATTDRHLALLILWLSSLPSLARLVGANAVDSTLLVVRSSMLFWPASEGKQLSIGDVALDAALISHDIPAKVVAQWRLKGESAAYVAVLARFMSKLSFATLSKGGWDSFPPGGIAANLGWDSLPPGGIAANEGWD